MPQKILLIQPPIEDFYITRKRTIPYGLAGIAAALEQQGFQTEIFDALATDKSKEMALPPEFDYLSPYFGRQDLSLFSLFHKFCHHGYSFEHIGNLVRQKKPFIVGISCLFTAYAGQALETARVVKKFYPDAVTVLGGHHPTHFPEQVLSCPQVDYVIRGEGETGFPQLCKALASGVDLSGIPGIAFRHDKEIHINPPAWIDDLSTLPSPLISHIRHDYYQRGKKACLTIVTSRGCPMPCSYCSVSARSAHGRFRQRKVEDVLKEISGLARQVRVGFIDFEDENLSLDKPYFMALLDGITEIFGKEPPELRAMNGLFPPSLDRDMITAMKNAGFKTLNLSLGSTSTEQLRRFTRPDVRKAHDNALDLAREQGLSTVSYIIAAAPFQTALSSVKDLLYLAKRPTLAGLSIFYPAPGSPDFKMCQKKHLLPGTFSLMRSTALPIEHETTRVQSVTLLRLARILNYVKARIDKGFPLPRALPFDPSMAFKDLTDREGISEKLLSFFLWDGSVFGVGRDGTPYEHAVDKALCKAFIEGLANRPLIGTRDMSTPSNPPLTV